MKLCNFKIMIMKKIYYLVLILIAGLILYSCSKFEEYNTDPNSTSKVTPGMLATNLILGTMTYSHVGAEFLSKDMLAKYISYMEGARDLQYNKFDRTYFSSMVKLTNIKKMEEAAKGSFNEDSYIALGHFLRSYTFFNLTMAVGDIPYSDALKGEEGIYNPKYDSQKDVFIGILNELDLAAELFAKGKSFDGDPVYKGNALKWLQATNSLKLKILLNLMKKTGDVDLKVKERFAAVVNENKIFQSNADNFQLTYSSLEVENYPFYNSNFRDYPIMSTTIVDKMKDLKDTRLFYYAEAAEAKVASGVASNNWNAYVGVNPSDEFGSIASKYNAKQISKINKRYSSLNKGEPTFLLSYAEQCFIISEGILLGWVSGDAKSYYDNGVKAAFTFVGANTPDDTKYHHGMKITTSTITTYLSDSKVAFSGTDDEKLKKIWQQRYFLGFMQDGYNTYYEYRRVGYPEFPINTATNLNSDPNKIPVRWLYPSNELESNREHVQEAIDRQFSGNDDSNQLMWILK